MTRGQAQAAAFRRAQAISMMKQTGLPQTYLDGNGVSQTINPAVVGVATESAAMTAARQADAIVNPNTSYAIQMAAAQKKKNTFGLMMGAGLIGSCLFLGKKK